MSGRNYRREKYWYNLYTKYAKKFLDEGGDENELLCMMDFPEKYERL